MNSTPLPKDLVPAEVSPIASKSHHMRIVGLLAMGVLTVSSLFTILAKPQAFASLFNANRDLAMNSDLLMVGAKVKKPISGPISSPISSPINRVPKPKVTEFLVNPTKIPEPGPLTGTPAPSPTVTPTLLPPQTSNKRVFLTSTTYTGNLGGVAGADQKCQESAKTAGLSGIWKAWLSGAGSSVNSRFTRTLGNYVELDGSVIAQGWADLTDGQLGSDGINQTEQGKTVVAQVPVWTSTYVTGETAVYADGNGNCNAFTSAGNGETALAGFSATGTNVWTNAYSEMCTKSLALYCFEQ